MNKELFRDLLNNKDLWKIKLKGNKVVNPILMFIEGEFIFGKGTNKKYIDWNYKNLLEIKNNFNSKFSKDRGHKIYFDWNDVYSYGSIKQLYLINNKINKAPGNNLVFCDCLKYKCSLVFCDIELFGLGIDFVKKGYHYLSPEYYKSFNSFNFGLNKNVLIGANLTKDLYITKFRIIERSQNG